MNEIKKLFKRESLVSFDEGPHKYYRPNGSEIPSVSTIKNFILGDEYADVDKEILKRAQDYGTDVHAIIQDYLETGDLRMPSDDIRKQIAIEDFLRIKDRHIMKHNLCEVMIDYELRYAGRFDLLSMGDKLILIDFKTNSLYPKEALEWQCGFYMMALNDMGVYPEEAWCLWLPKSKSASWHKVEFHSNQECLKALEEYEASVALPELKFV